MNNQPSDRAPSPYSQKPDDVRSEPTKGRPIKKGRSNGDDRKRIHHDDTFIRGDRDQILCTHHGNVREAVKLLHIELCHNEFSTQTEVKGLLGFGRELTDAGADQIRFLIEETYGFMPSKDLFNDTLSNIAHRNGFHPVKNYLDGLHWDGSPRIDNWLHNYGGAEDTAFNRAIGRIFLIAACRRVREPGCKFDTMLVLESPVQGKNKSSALRILATREEWFSDSLPLGADVKEVIEQTSGIWIAECAELNGLKTREEEHIMTFLSRQVDKARPAYGRRRENVPRQFVAFATTNEEEYLKKDERRLWPVRIDKFNLEKLRRDVDQLWAEANFYEGEGESITLQEDLWSAASEARADRGFENPYYSTLAERYENSVVVRGADMWKYLGIPAEQQPRAAKQVGMALRKLGFTAKFARGNCQIAETELIRNERYYIKE